MVGIGVGGGYRRSGEEKAGGIGRRQHHALVAARLVTGDACVCVSSDISVFLFFASQSQHKYFIYIYYIYIYLFPAK